MIQLLYRLSGFFFYLLGSSFFVAYALLTQKLWSTEAAVWMQIADLPLAFAALTYGGLSLYMSLGSPDEQLPRVLPWIIGIPLAMIFGLILAMNFWS